MIDIWIQIIIFLLGLAIGSFLNVCIYRIPRTGLSVHSPRRSFCTQCSQPIRAYDNIPLLSYLFLRGKCRHCKAKISVIYPIVELATAVLFLAMFYQFGRTLDFLHALIFVSILIPIFVIDLQHHIIPNYLIIIGSILGIVIIGAISYQRSDIIYLLKRLAGFVIGGGVLWLVAIIANEILYRFKLMNRFLRKPKGGDKQKSELSNSFEVELRKPTIEVMGGGDIKLMALNGLFLGLWPELVMVIGLSSILGAVIGLIAKKSMNSRIPYGPFIAVAAVVVLLWGDVLWVKYLQLAGWN